MSGPNKLTTGMHDMLDEHTTEYSNTLIKSLTDLQERLPASYVPGLRVAVEFVDIALKQWIATRGERS